MARDNSRYQQMETYMTYALIAGAGFFVLYLIFAGYGVTWLKVITAILTIATGVLCLGVLFLTRELTRHRSLWMTSAAVALLLCTVISLAVSFPSPTPTVTTTNPSGDSSARGEILNDSGIVLVSNDTGRIVCQLK